LIWSSHLLRTGEGKQNLTRKKEGCELRKFEWKEILVPKGRLIVTGGWGNSPTKRGRGGKKGKFTELGRV